MECAGNGRTHLKPRYWVHMPWDWEAIGTALWTGTPLRGILEECGVLNEASEILFSGQDKGIQGEEVQVFQRSLSLANITEDVLLVYAMNGQPLLPQHGFPLRLIVPGWYGMTNVKWLDSIELTSKVFNGVQMRAYMYKNSDSDVGTPVRDLNVRALMVPPGIPEFFLRTRYVEEGLVMLEGRAWSGNGRKIAKVQVSTNGAKEWHDATLGTPLGKYAWASWSFPWQATVGKYCLCAKATDEEGFTQEVVQRWNSYGMGNNMVQLVDVVVMQKGSLEDGNHVCIGQLPKSTRL